MYTTKEQIKEQLIKDIEDNYGFMINYAYLKVGDYDLAKDIVQESCLGVLKIDRYDGNFRNLIRTIIKNNTINYFRTGKNIMFYKSSEPYCVLPDGPIGTINHPNLLADKLADDTLLKACKKVIYSKYQPKYRRIFYFTLQGYKHREIADILAIPEGTVKTALFAIKNYLLSLNLR